MHSLKIMNIVSNFCRLIPVSFIPSVFYITQSKKVSCGIAYYQMETMPETSSEYFAFLVCAAILWGYLFTSAQVIIATLF